MRFYRVVTRWPSGEEDENLTRETLASVRLRGQRAEANGATVRIWDVGLDSPSPGWAWARFYRDYHRGILRIDWAAIERECAENQHSWRDGTIHRYFEVPLRRTRPMTRQQREQRAVTLIFEPLHEEEEATT